MKLSLPSLLSLAVLMFVSAVSDGLAVGLSDEELFGMKAVLTEPLDGKVLDSTTEEGIVIENIEFTTRTVDGKPERVVGVFAYPEGAKNLPAVFWSMGGMASAKSFFPVTFAKKGYASLAITLPHPIRNSQAAFDVANPKNGNFTLLVRDQLRGITYLSQRPETNPDLMAVGGASYGGVFATLLAGIDPRLKAGMSFFGGGNQIMGTNLPQFTKLQSLAEAEVWKQTVDPAVRHKTRDVPFLWAVPFNDNWFYFPSVIQTYKDALSPEKRLVIMPRWRHGFPPNVDEEIFDFPNTVLTKTRLEYNNPGGLKLANEGGKPVFRFDWTGDNPVKKAELIVSYGENTPWFGWQHRACFVFPAKIEGKSASAELPLPSRTQPLLVWANITDERDVVTSTVPVTLERDDLATFGVDSKLRLNCFYDAEFGPEAVGFYQRSSQLPNAVVDQMVKHSGTQSLRIEVPAPTPAKANAKGKAKKVAAPKPHALRIDLFHSVPGLAHKFSVWVKASELAKITATLTPVRPPNWDSTVVAEVVAKDPRLAGLLPAWKNIPVAMSASVDADSDWKEITIDVPVPVEPVDGYVLTIGTESRAPFWVDSLRMEPVWP